MNIKIDFNAPEFKEKDGVYYSVTYQMRIPNRERQKELDKTYYIKDITVRIKRMQELIGDNPEDIGVTVTKGEALNYKSLGFNSYDELLDKQEQGMFYGVWVEIRTLRKLELEYYLQKIYDKAIEIKTTKQKPSESDNVFNAVCYLIDEQYKKHSGVFSDKRADTIFSAEYDQLIYDYVGKMIKKISSVDIEAEKTQIDVQIKKPFKWNADKTALGTLFGLLHKAKIIEGTAIDVNRFIMAGFEGFSEETLKDNIALKITEQGTKVLYHKDTESDLKGWIETLKK